MFTTFLNWSKVRVVFRSIFNLGVATSCACWVKVFSFFALGTYVTNYEKKLVSLLLFFFFLLFFFLEDPKGVLEGQSFCLFVHVCFFGLHVDDRKETWD
jgi:Ca2+/Na+ antiporter